MLDEYLRALRRLRIWESVLPDRQMQSGAREAECSEYPCDRYAHIDEYDSFITHMNQKADLEKMQRIGEEAYNIEQVEKRQILDRLLAEYNDGRKKTLFCLAVNLLPLEELRIVFEDGDLEIPEKDRARQMENRLKEKSSAELKLRKK